MKLVKESLYEKFTPESDPIKDMGIGKIRPFNVYHELVMPGISKWYEFLKSLRGKTIEGYMGAFTPDSTVNMMGKLMPDPTAYNKVEVVKANWESTDTANIIVIDKDDNSFILYGSNEYMIR